MFGKLLLVVSIASLVAEAPQVANAQDTVPGAIWVMKFTTVAGPKREARGAFRIHNGKMYQPPLGTDINVDEPDLTIFTRVVGTSVENKKTHQNRFKFDDAVAYKGKQRPSPASRIQFSGIGTSKLQKIGHWKGRFAASNGFSWDFEVRRVAE